MLIICDIMEWEYKSKSRNMSTLQFIIHDNTLMMKLRQRPDIEALSSLWYILLRYNTYFIMNKFGIDARCHIKTRI